MLGFAGADKLFGFHRVEPRTTRRSNAGSSTDTGRAWAHPENSLVSAASCTCSSRPTTVSHSSSSSCDCAIIFVEGAAYHRWCDDDDDDDARDPRTFSGPKMRAAVVSPHRDASARRNIRDASRHERAMVARVSGAQLKYDESGRAKVWLWARRKLRFDWYNWQRTAVPFRSPSFMILVCLPIRQLQRPLTCLRNFKKTVKPLFKEIQIPWTHAAPAHSS